jgi:hypothetical protein
MSSLAGIGSEAGRSGKFELGEHARKFCLARERGLVERLSGCPGGVGSPLIVGGRRDCLHELLVGVVEFQQFIARHAQSETGVVIGYAVVGVATALTMALQLGEAIRVLYIMFVWY